VASNIFYSEKTTPKRTGQSKASDKTASKSKKVINVSIDLLKNQGATPHEGENMSEEGPPNRPSQGNNGKPDLKSKERQEKYKLMKKKMRQQDLSSDRSPAPGNVSLEKQQQKTPLMSKRSNQA